MTNPHHIRFSEAQWYQQQMPDVTIGGVGGIGSWLAIFLGRMGVPMYIHDMDTVEEVNMAGQAYFPHQTGQSKTAAVQEVVHKFTAKQDIEIMGEFTADCFASDISFACFDSMKARKLLFERWKENPERKLLVDGRMLMEQGMIFCVVPGREKEYEATLFDDAEVGNVPCSAKAVSHGGALIASLMAGIFTNFLANEAMGLDIREVPFHFSYNVHLMMFENEQLVTTS